MLSIVYLNIRSLPKHFDEFRLTPDLVKNDIICFSETWFNGSHYDNNFQLPGYILIRKDRGVTSRGGGLAVYIKQNVKFEKVDLVLCGGTEVLCIEIVAANSRFCLVLVYNPPCIASADVSCNFEKLLDANN